MTSQLINSTDGLECTMYNAARKPYSNKTGRVRTSAERGQQHRDGSTETAAQRGSHPAVAVLDRHPLPCCGAGWWTVAAAATALRAVAAAALVLRLREIARRRRPLPRPPPAAAAAARRRVPGIGGGGGLAAALSAAAPVRGAQGRPAGGRRRSYGVRREHQWRPGPGPEPSADSPRAGGWWSRRERPQQQQAPRFGLRTPARQRHSR